MNLSDFEVVWDGVNDHHDADLLVTERIPEKRAGARLTPKAIRVDVHMGDRLAHTLDYRAVFDVLRERRCTVDEVQLMCAFTSRQVQTAINRLRRAGLLHHAVGPAQEVGRPATVYWIEAEL